MRFVAALTAAGLSLIALAAAALIAAGGDALAQSTATVQVGDFYFCDPSYAGGICETTVNEGDTVEWQFAGNELHSTTECSDDHDSCSAPHLWDSPLLDSGSFSFTFETPGTFLYRCQAHTTEMRGRVIVLAAAQPSPSPEASPQASTPAATPTPAAQPSAVPAGGGEPPDDGGSGLWWVAVLVGGMLIASAAGLAARGLRRRDG
ncbi:MAG: hypothetical protein Q7R32_09535 [Dehalococcoidia bacterium]|nr:hypothetical protein [Dehalococcoidia bacterium]